MQNSAIGTYTDAEARYNRLLHLLETAVKARSVVAQVVIELEAECIAQSHVCDDLRRKKEPANAD